MVSYLDPKPRGPLFEAEYDPEAEIACQLEECVENLCQAIKRSARRSQFETLLAALLAVKVAQEAAQGR
jgi:hypothetical protein